MADRRARSPRFHGGRNASRCRYAQGPVVGACGRARQARAVSVGNDAFRPLDLAGAEQWPDGQSGGVPDPFVRHLDAGLPAGHAVHHALAPPDRAASAGAAPHVRAVCLFYGFLHFMAWVWWDRGFDPAQMLADIGERPFITVGFVAFVLMAALAATSTQWAMRRLGKRWQRLPGGVRHRPAGGVALLVAQGGQERPGTTHDLRRRAGGAAGLAGGRLVAASFLSAGGCRPPRVVCRGG